MRTFILREIGQKKCFQYEVDDIIDKYKEGDFFKVYSPVNNKNKECRIVKIIEQWRKPITLILKRKDNGEHIKLKVTNDLISLWKKFYKEIKVGFEVDYVPKDGIGFVECVCVKIIEGREKDEDKGGGILPKGAIFSEYNLGHEIPDYMKGIIGEIVKPGKIIFSYSMPGKNFMYNEYLKDHLARLARCKERSKLMHAIDEREKLKEFHKRPYVKLVVKEVKGKPMGGEESDKILFPCWCLYYIYGQVFTGELNCEYRGGTHIYKLYRMGDQTRGANLIESSTSVQYLLNEYKIEILKGELKLWREVGKKGDSKKKEQ